MSNLFKLMAAASLLLSGNAIAHAAPAATPTPAPVKTISCEAYPIPKETTSGSGYTAVSSGPDGKVYVGTAVYGGSAHLVQFDPRKKSFVDLIDMHRLTGEHGAGLDSQSKIHTKPVFDSEGRVYAGSKQGNEEFVNRPEYGEDPDGYPGAHLFSYDPKTGHAIDYGILERQEGLMGGAIDNKRHRLYYWSFPKTNLLRFDLDSGKTYNFGPTGTGSRYMACAPDGTVWVPARGLWVRYRPDSDHLEDVLLDYTGATPYQDLYSLAMTPDGKKIYGAAIDGKYIWEFEPVSDGATIKARPICAAIPEGWKLYDIHASVLGNDGAYYYPAVVYEDGNNTMRPHLMRVWPKTGEREDLGVITPKTTGKFQPYFQGMTISADGTLYMTSIEPYTLLVFPKLTGRK